MITLTVVAAIYLLLTFVVFLCKLITLDINLEYYNNPKEHNKWSTGLNYDSMWQYWVKAFKISFSWPLDFVLSILRYFLDKPKYRTYDENGNRIY